MKEPPGGRGAAEAGQVTRFTAGAIAARHARFWAWVLIAVGVGCILLGGIFFVANHTGHNDIVAIVTHEGPCSHGTCTVHVSYYAGDREVLAVMHGVLRGEVYGSPWPRLNITYPASDLPDATWIVSWAVGLACVGSGAWLRWRKGRQRMLSEAAVVTGMTPEHEAPDALHGNVRRGELSAAMQPEDDRLRPAWEQEEARPGAAELAAARLGREREHPASATWPVARPGNQEDYEKQAAQHGWNAQPRAPVIPPEVEAAWLEVKAAWPREARAWPPREARAWLREVGAWLREVGAWLLELGAWLEVPFNNAVPERWERRKRDQASLDAARRITGIATDARSLRYMSFAYQMVAHAIRGRADLRYYSHATGGGKGTYLMLEAEGGPKALVCPVPNAGEVDTSEIMRDVKDHLAVLSADVGTDRVLLITDGELPGSLRGIIESHPYVEAVSIRDGSDGWKLILSIDKVLGLPR